MKKFMTVAAVAAISAVGQGMDGSRAENTIFVLALDGETPEFTKVIR